MTRIAWILAWLAVAGTHPPRAADPPKAGEPAPEIMACQPDGNGVPFPEALKGRIVLVVFWELDASGTGGLPRDTLRRLRAAHDRDDRFLILTVCVSGPDRSAEWTAWVGAQGEVAYGGRRVNFLDDPRWWNAYEIGRDASRLTHRRFGAATFPSCHLIGADGRLVANGVPEPELEQVVAQALAAGKVRGVPEGQQRPPP